MAVRILSVDPRSIADHLQLEAGDRIVSINGTRIQDVLDLKYHLSADEVFMEVGKGDETVHYRLEALEAPLGIEVEPIKTKLCANDCLFCFIDQLPEGTRSTLKIRDDDYRLSFLHGNYVTLSNMTEREIDRIIEQRLSPLFVSVHATDMRVRNFLLGRRKEAVFWPRFQRLLEGGIQLNCQVVLCPTINDGGILKDTIYDLLACYPGVHSIAIVPLGLSDHPAEKMRMLSPVTDWYCRQVTEQVEVYQREIRSRIGRTFAYLADEFYIRAGRALPPASGYDGFPQLEDGIGMARLFLRDFDRGLRRLRKTPLRFLRGHRATVATGTLFAPLLRRAIARFGELTGAKWEVLVVPNRFLGSGITVAGLMAGADIINAAQGQDLGRCLAVPSESLANEKRLFLDDMSIEEVSRSLDLPVVAGGFSSADFFENLPGIPSPWSVAPDPLSYEQG